MFEISIPWGRIRKGCRGEVAALSIGAETALAGLDGLQVDTTGYRLVKVAPIARESVQ